MTYEQARDLIKENPGRIGYYVGFDDLTDMHNYWLKDLLFKPEDQTKQAHRGSYKTSCDSLFIALNAIIRPWQRLIFLRKTDTDVQEVIRQTKEILNTGAMRTIAQAITGAEIKLTKDSVNEIDLNIKQGIAGSSQVIGYGIGASLTGKHADVILTDDIVNIRDRISRADREKTKLIYQELQNVRNRNGRILNTGTPWHQDDCFSLMPPAEKYDCYTTGLIAPDKLREIRASMTASLFSCNYELKHIADENALFTNAEFCDAKDAVKIYDGIAHLDAGYDGEDFTALTVAHEADGIIYIFGKMWQEHVLQHMDEIEALKAKYRAGTMHMETNADKAFLARTFEGRGNLVETYHESMNKFLKISTYLKREWSRIRFLPDTDPEYISQILDYTERATHDDAPDSLASIIRILTDGTEIQLFPGGII